MHGPGDPVSTAWQNPLEAVVAAWFCWNIAGCERLE